MIKFRKNIELWLLISLFSCDNMENLGNGYYYVSPFEVLDNGFPYGSLVYKSYQKNAFQYFIVWSEVIDIKNNNRYIVVKQKPNYDAFRKRFFDLCEIDKINQEGGDTIYNSLGHSGLMFIPQSELQSVLILIKKGKCNLSSKQLDSVLFLAPSVLKYFKNDTNYFVVDKHKNTISEPLNHEQFKKIINLNRINEML